MIGALSLAGVLLGAVPELYSPNAPIAFSNAAYAQNFSDQDLQNYVRAAVPIEIRRQQVVAEIKDMIGYVPSIRCDQPSSLSSLPDSARQKAVDYCNWAIGIVESNNLGIQQFNSIMAAQQGDPQLENRIRCIQQPSACQ